MFGHGGHHVPLVGIRHIALHRVQGRDPVESTADVEFVTHGNGPHGAWKGKRKKKTIWWRGAEMRNLPLMSKIKMSVIKVFKDHKKEKEGIIQERKKWRLKIGRRTSAAQQWEGCLHNPKLKFFIFFLSRLEETQLLWNRWPFKKGLQFHFFNTSEPALLSESLIRSLMLSSCFKSR